MAVDTTPEFCLRRPVTDAERTFCDEDEASSLPDLKNVENIRLTRGERILQKAREVQAQRVRELAVIEEYKKTPLTPGNRPTRIQSQLALRYVYDRISEPGIRILQTMRVGDDEGYLDLTYRPDIAPHLPINTNLPKNLEGYGARTISDQLLPPHKHSFYKCSGSFENLAARISKLIANGLVMDALKQLQNCQGARQKRPGERALNDAHRVAITKVAEAIVDLRALIATRGPDAVTGYKLTYTPGSVGFKFIAADIASTADAPEWKPQGAKRRKTHRKNGRKRRHTKKLI